MTSIQEYELFAWEWLRDLPRLEWDESLTLEANHRRRENQILIRAAPGAKVQLSGRKEMLIRLSVAHPDLGKGERVKGFGISLWEAANDVHMKLWRLGIKLPLIRWK